MKKFGILFFTAFLGAASLSNVYAVGQNDDEETSCEAVNQQNIKDSPGAEASGTSSSGSSAQGI